MQLQKLHYVAFVSRSKRKTKIVLYIYKDNKYHYIFKSRFIDQFKFFILHVQICVKCVACFGVRNLKVTKRLMKKMFFPFVEDLLHHDKAF